MTSTYAFLRTWRRTVFAGTLAFAILTMVAIANAQGPNHPLDGLTPIEIWTAYDVLQTSHKVDADTRFPMVQLREPPKEEVLAWKPGQPMRREAFLVVRQGGQTFEAVVDVNSKQLVSWMEMKGIQREAPSPLTVQQPQGLSFRLNGESVHWQNWNFHFRIDRRVGLVVTNVAYQDGDKLRSILYEGSLSELFMAYQDASEDWIWATFFDIGESGDGSGQY
jgi:Cu2+-containing amine oxidase